MDEFERGVCRSMSERVWTRHFIQLAQSLGWRTVHFRPARTVKGWRTAVEGDGIGFPDVLCLRDVRLVVTELKTEKGRPTRDQTDWLAAWQAVGAETYIWRPSDRHHIVEVLA